MAQTWKMPDGNTVTVFIADVVTTDDGKVHRRQPDAATQTKQDMPLQEKNLNGGN